ncbi:MAG: helix-turn-helix domain-containing protein [Gammaproteobacteria bacterium]|nr:helix-turn-helix domain-containing protein [Gammaproteobacteria bacterium]
MLESIQSAVLSEKDAAVYIGMSVAFLQKDRMNGQLAGRTPGPKWIKAGRRVLYRKSDLDHWLQQHLVQRSKSP